MVIAKIKEMPRSLFYDLPSYVTMDSRVLASIYVSFTDFNIKIEISTRLYTYGHEF